MVNRKNIRFCVICSMFAVILICSCNQDNHAFINYDDYNIYLFEDFTRIDFVPVPVIPWTRIKDYVCCISNWGFYEGENRFMYSWDKNKHYIKGNDLEIVFVREQLGELSLLRPENCLIGAKFIHNQLKAFYILWQNKGIKPVQDSLKYYGTHYSWYYDKELDSSIREYKNIKAYYNWDIGSETELLVTNLDFKTIKSIFPEFNGNFKKVTIDSIKLNYDYPIETIRFYNEIKFYNSTLDNVLYKRDYCK